MQRAAARGMVAASLGSWLVALPLACGGDDALERCAGDDPACVGDGLIEDAGVPDADASAPADGCGPHGRLDGLQCRCDPGFTQDGLGDAITCVAIPGCAGSNDEFEPNDEPALATRLPGPTTVEAYICPADGDWYVLPLEAGDTIRASAVFDGPAVDIDLYLFGPTSPSPVDASAGLESVERVEFTTPRAGSAGIYVRGYGIGEGDYELRIETVAGEVPPCAGPGGFCRTNADCCSNDCHINHCH